MSYFAILLYCTHFPINYFLSYADILLEKQSMAVSSALRFFFFFCCKHSQLVWLGLVCQAYFGNGLRINSVLKTIITFLAPEAGSGFLCLASFCTCQRLVLDKQKDGRDKICVFLAIYTHKATDLKWTATCPCL